MDPGRLGKHLARQGSTGPWAWRGISSRPSGVRRARCSVWLRWGDPSPGEPRLPTCPLDAPQSSSLRAGPSQVGRPRSVPVPPAQSADKHPAPALALATAGHLGPGAGSHLLLQASGSLD